MARTWVETCRGVLRDTRIRFVGGVVSLIGLALTLVVHILSISGIDVEASSSQVWLLHFALFPLICLALLTSWSLIPQRNWGLRAIIALIPRSILVLLILALIYTFGNFAFLVPQTGVGQPIARGGSFFFDNHGSIIEVTEAQYHYMRALTIRLYSAFWLYLYFFSTTVLLVARERT